MELYHGEYGNGKWAEGDRGKPVWCGIRFKQYIKIAHSIGLGI
jgi:hypothetical protein